MRTRVLGFLTQELNFLLLPSCFPSPAVLVWYFTMLEILYAPPGGFAICCQGSFPPVDFALSGLIALQFLFFPLRPFNSPLTYDFTCAFLSGIEECFRSILFIPRLRLPSEHNRLELFCHCQGFSISLKKAVMLHAIFFSFYVACPPAPPSGTVDRLPDSFCTKPPIGSRSPLLVLFSPLLFFVELLPV